MIVLTGVSLPFHRHFLGTSHVLIGCFLITLDTGHLCIAGNAHDSLDGEVGVVSPVTCEVICAKLVSGILTVLGEIVCPSRDDVPVFIDILGVTVDAAQLSSQRQHITGLLQRHVATIDLTIGDGICAQVMSREGLGPAATVAIVEDTGHLSLLQLGVVDEEEGSLGISEVNRIHAAVGVVLLGEEQEVAVLVLEELMGSNHVAIGSGKDLGIFLIAGIQGVIVDHLIEVAAALHDACVLLVQTVEHVEDAHFALVSPVALIALVHIFNILHLVIANHHEIGSLLGLTQVAAEGNASVLGSAYFTIDSGHIEIAPVDADTVALLGQDGLIHGTALAVLHATFGDELGRGALVLLVERQFTGSGDAELHVVRLAVGATNLIGDIVDGGREQIVVVHQEGSREHDIQFYGPAHERIIGVGS